MKRFLSLLLAFVSPFAFAQEVRRFTTMGELLSANPSAFSVAGKATVIVTGDAVASDGWSRLLSYSAQDTAAADNLTVFRPSNTNFPGRYTLLFLENPTNSNVRAGIIPKWEPNKLWFNGSWNYLTNLVSGSGVSADTNGLLTISGSDDWKGFVYGKYMVTNWALVGNDISDSFGPLEWYVQGGPSGTNLYALVASHSLEFSKLNYLRNDAILGPDLSTASGGFSTVGPVTVGANLSLSLVSGETVLSATVPTGTNSFQIGVDGSVVSTPNLSDSSEINPAASGSNVTFSLVTGSIASSKLADSGASAGTYQDPSITVNAKGLVTSISSGSRSTVTVDGGADLSRVNLADGSEILAALSGTNASFTLSPTLDLGGKTSLEIPNGASPTTDVFGEIAGDNNAWAVSRGAVQFFDGTANTYLVGALSSDTPVAGQVPTWNSDGTITWETPSAGGGGSTNGTAVTVDGGVDLTRVNFADSAEITFSLSGTNATAGIPSVLDLGGKTSFELPNSSTPVVDAFGEIAGDNDAWAASRGAVRFYDGTASTFLVGTLTTDTPSNGQVPTWNTGGTITWETPPTGAAFSVDGGSDQTRINFADSASITFTLTGTNVTAGIPDDSIALGTKTTGFFISGVAGTANEISVSGSGSEAATATVSLPATIDLGGKTSFELPNGVTPTTDAFGEIAGDNNAWASGRGAVQFYDGTANTFLVGALATDTPLNGQVPTWNTGGTVTWETPSAGGGSPVSNVVQRTGYAEFTVNTSYAIENLVVGGVITNVTMAAGGVSTRGLFDFAISPARSGTNYVVQFDIEGEDPTGLGSPNAAVVYNTKTTTAFQLAARFDNNERVPNGTKYLVWIVEPVEASGVGTTTNYVVVPFSSASYSPADASTYYIGGMPGLSPRTGATQGPMIVPLTGTIIAWNIHTYSTVTGSGETVNAYLRLNNTTDFGVSADTYDAEYTNVRTTGLGQAVTAGDELMVKIVTPTWSVNPTTVLHSGWYMIQK